MAHAEAKEAFERHWPLWKAQAEKAEDMLLWFPEDSKFHVDGISQIAVGKKQHHGEQAIRRFITIIQHLAGLEYDRFLVYEYDSFSLKPFPPFAEDIAANVFTDPNPANGFHSHIYTHPPLAFSKAGIEKIAKQMRKTINLENGFWDRYLGLAITLSGATVHNLLATGTGFSRNTIERADEKSAYTAVMERAIHFHGVKTKEVYQSIMRAHDRRTLLDEAQRINAEEV